MCVDLTLFLRASGCAAAILAVAMCVSTGGPGAQHAQPAGGDDAGVGQVLDDFHDAASKADFDRYFRNWPDDSVFLGTDATERWVGPQFRDFARPYFAKGTGWTYHPRDRHISLDPNGNFAWFDELLDNDKYGECRGSGILAQRDGRWLILQYNLSIPIPNDMAGAETARIAEWKKVNGPAPSK